MKALRVSLYFVASPLQYLAARRIAESIETEARQVLVWYQPGITPIVKSDDWDASLYIPWPRKNPLPGLFGVSKRLVENLHLVANLVGQCDTLIIHSAVFDTEAINYFLRALPKLCNASAMHARILPDGLISIRRYPLSVTKAAFQCFRKFRKLYSRELNYWCFTGDRIGSDAPFCDRIYVLAGLPHEYPSDKVHVLPPLVRRNEGQRDVSASRRALVIGQPLEGAGLMKASDRDRVAKEIHDWLQEKGIQQIDYKGHPKDPNLELNEPSYRIVETDQPLETYLAENAYSIVVGVRSSALIFARQIYDANTDVVAFGWDKVVFRSERERQDMRDVFHRLRVQFK
ncbi:MAG: hypothetical protein C4516_05995 [Oxalobacter sp.]|nr:MAG: hypothetical protein C4516_05995 [Oxalobacter sp.]